MNNCNLCWIVLHVFTLTKLRPLPPSVKQVTEWANTVKQHGESKCHKLLSDVEDHVKGAWWESAVLTSYLNPSA